MAIGPIQLLRQATTEQRRTLLAASLGWMLDAFDAMLYALVLTHVMRDLGMSKATSGRLCRLCWHRGWAAKALRPVLRPVIDARDFNNSLSDLIDGNIGSKDQFAPPAHASRTATVRKRPQLGTAVIDGLHGVTSSGGIVFFDAPKYAFQIVCGEG
jgi:hypothetical protein